MTYLTPAALAGLGVVAAPVAIHLLNKLRVKVIKWGAMRFLQETVKKNQRRLQMEDLILLLLRCLLIALLALAFARPVIHPEGLGGAGSEGPMIAMLLFDQSASMGQSNGVNTRFEAARTAAGKILDDLPRGSQAALYLVTDHVNQIIPKPTSNLALIRHSLDVTEPTSRISDLLPAIRLALDALQRFTGSKKEIIIFTDNQLVAWKQIATIKSLLADAADVSVKLVPTGSDGENNLAITSLKPENMVPATGQVYGCIVEVTNFSPEAATGVRVTLSLDDEASSDEAVIDSIPPGQARAVRLNVKFPQAGFHTVSASIPPDRLPVDNQRAMAVQVIDQMRAAIVEGTSPASKQDRDGFFLANALMPVAPSRRADYFLKAETVPVSWLDDADFSREEMIFLANVSTVTPAEAQKLQKYVSDGGALIIFPGPNTQPENFNAALKDLLPAKLETLREPGKSGLFASWQKSGYAHPVTALWNDTKDDTLGTVRATADYPLTLATAKDPAEAPLAIVKYLDESPAVAERSLGRGHVVLFSSTANTLWNNLPIHPDFVPFLQRLSGYVSRHESADKLILSPGAVYQHKVNNDLIGHDFSVVRPDSKGKPRLAGKVGLSNRDAIVQYQDTEETGAYRIYINGSDRPVGAFAVQMDPQESNLRAIAADSLAGIEKDKDATTAPEAAPQGTGGVRREFWGLLIWLAAIIAVAEMLLAHKFSLSK